MSIINMSRVLAVGAALVISPDAFNDQMQDVVVAAMQILARDLESVTHADGAEASPMPITAFLAG